MTVIHLPTERIEAAKERRWQQQHDAIRNFYLSLGRTEQQWHVISADHHKFNRVWRYMLKLPPDDKPPPKEYR